MPISKQKSVEIFRDFQADHSGQNRFRKQKLMKHLYLAEKRRGQPPMLTLDKKPSKKKSIAKKLADLWQGINLVDNQLSPTSDRKFSRNWLSQETPYYLSLNLVSNAYPQAPPLYLTETSATTAHPLYNPSCSTLGPRINIKLPPFIVD